MLGPYAAQGIPIVGLEPSCTAVLRSDLVDLLPDDPRAAEVAGAARTLAELLTGTHGRAGLAAARPDRARLIVQPHCHHHAVMGFAADRRAARPTWAPPSRVVAGCCGLAGNFGMEKGHYEMSVAVAENALLPALRERPAGSDRAGRRILLPHPDRPTRRAADADPGRALGQPHHQPPLALRRPRPPPNRQRKVFRNVQPR